jgi:hypothetical protein
MADNLTCHAGDIVLMRAEIVGVGSDGAFRGELPMQIINLLPPAQTLRQGRKEVSDQFTYSFRSTEEERHSVFYAVFRQSFAVAAVTALDRSEFLMKNADKYPVTVPGDFRQSNKSTWRHVEKQLNAAALGGVDTIDVAVPMQMVLSMEGVTYLPQ